MIRYDQSNKTYFKSKFPHRAIVECNKQVRIEDVHFAVAVHIGSFLLGSIQFRCAVVVCNHQIGGVFFCTYQNVGAVGGIASVP